MKCTIVKVVSIKLDGDRNKAVVEGFIPMNTELIPEKIMNWIYYYTGIRVSVFCNGLQVASSAETTCSMNDDYDERIGSHIAESKAKAKIYRFIRTFSDFMYDYYNNIADEFEDATLKYQRCVEHEEDHINYLGDLD